MEHEHGMVPPTTSASLPLVVQPTMTVGAVDDPFESEADRVAIEVVARLAEQSNGPVETSDGGTRVRRSGVPRPSRQISRAGSRVRRSATAGQEVGSEGGEISRELTGRIRRAVGGGAPMEEPVRSAMESAFDADFRGVRIHTGSESTELNREVGAAAFTVGNDVFFAGGNYQPTAQAGQHLLAHELTHTLQQGGADGRRSVIDGSIQRLAVAGTNWANTTEVHVMQGGASGRVAKFDDGSRPVIVKTDQTNASEVLVAGELLTSSLGDRTDGVSGDVPAARLVSAAEVALIHQQATQKTVPGANPQRDQDFLNNIGGATVVMEMAPGKTLRDVTRGEKHTEPGPRGQPGSRVGRKNSPLVEMATTPGPLTMLGRAAASDVLMGMTDRLTVAYNAENLMYDSKRKRFHFIDNTSQTPDGFLTTFVQARTPFGAIGDFAVARPRDGFMQWAAGEMIGDLARGNVTRIAGTIYTNMFGANGIQWDMNNNGSRPGATATEKATNANALQQVFQQHKASMIACLQNGLIEGTQYLLARLAGNPVSLVAGVAPGQRHEAYASIVARREVLTGVPPVPAWAHGVAAATAVLGPAPTTVGWPEVVDFFAAFGGIGAPGVDALLIVNNAVAGKVGAHDVAAFLVDNAERPNRLAKLAQVSGLAAADIGGIFGY